MDRAKQELQRKLEEASGFIIELETKYLQS